MGKGRLEAFSDGVIAIIITIMVLEMKVPHGESLESLLPLVSVQGRRAESVHLIPLRYCRNVLWSLTRSDHGNGLISQNGV